MVLHMTDCCILRPEERGSIRVCGGVLCTEKPEVDTKEKAGKINTNAGDRAGNSNKYE